MSKVVKIVQASLVAGIAVLSGCAAETPPPAPPPPPPVAVKAFPARPVAPGFAQDNLAVPPLSVAGVRQTVNTGLTSAQTTWNLRSAYNVAALNCKDAEHRPLADRYGAFLTDHARELSATNRALDGEFRKKYGPGFKDVRDRYMTQVYNYFALPPALDRFCAAALNASAELMTVKKGELDLASARLLPQLEGVFQQFFNDYESYRVAAMAWEASYLATYGVPYRRPGMNSMAPIPVSAPGGVPVVGDGTGKTGS